MQRNNEFKLSNGFLGLLFEEIESLKHVLDYLFIKDVFHRQTVNVHNQLIFSEF
jgi:hypothetical protein